MKIATIIMFILGFIGWGLTLYYSAWQVSLGLFLVIFQNNFILTKKGK